MLKGILYEKLTVSMFLNINLGLGPLVCNETTQSIICGLCQKACGWMSHSVVEWSKEKLRKFFSQVRDSINPAETAELS